MAETDIAAERAKLLKQRQSLEALRTEGNEPFREGLGNLASYKTGIGLPTLMTEADQEALNARNALLKDIAKQEELLTTQEKAERSAAAKKRVQEAAGILPLATTPPAETKAPVATPATTKTEPEAKQKVARMVKDEQGRKVWTFVDPDEPSHIGYSNPELGSQWEVRKAKEANLAAEAALGVSPATSGVDGTVNPRGFATRKGPGAFSPSWNPETSKVSAPAAEYSKYYDGLSPLQRQVSDELRQHGQRTAMEELQTKEAAASVKQRETAADEAADPVGFHDKQVTQQLAVVQAELSDPNSRLRTIIRAKLQEQKMKYPDATTEQLAELEAVLTRLLVDQESERRANIMTPSLRARVQEAQARSGMLGMVGTSTP